MYNSVISVLSEHILTLFLGLSLLHLYGHPLEQRIVQSLPREWLGYVVAHSVGQTLFHLLRGHERTHGHYRNPAYHLFLDETPDLLCGFEPVHHWHVVVHQDYQEAFALSALHLLFLHGFHCQSTVTHILNVKAQVQKHRLSYDLNELIILHYQYARASTLLPVLIDMRSHVAQHLFNLFLLNVLQVLRRLSPRLILHGYQLGIYLLERIVLAHTLLQHHVAALQLLGPAQFLLSQQQLVILLQIRAIVLLYLERLRESVVVTLVQVVRLLMRQELGAAFQTRERHFVAVRGVVVVQCLPLHIACVET